MTIPRYLLFDGQKRRLATLAGAYDVIYSYNPAGPWTSKHKCPLLENGDQFIRDDLNGIGKEMNVKSSNKIIDEIVEIETVWSVIQKKLV